MADVPQTLALIVLAQQFAGDIVRQINRKAQTLRMIPIVTGESQNVAWAAESGGQLAMAYSEGADTTDFGSDAQASAILPWASYKSPFRVTGLARAAARTTQTPAGNVQLWARNVVNSTAALASLINADIFAGAAASSPTEIEGLALAIGDDSNTYATINRASATYWRPTVIDPGAPDPLSFAKIRDDIRQIYEASGEKPDLAAVSPSVYNSVLGLFDSNRSYMQRVDEIQTARGAVKLDSGHSALIVDGCAFYEDKDATSATIHYLNSNHIELQVLPPAEVPALLPGTMLSANDGFGELPLMASFEMLATTGDSKKGEARVYTQLAVKKPCAFGVRKNVA
jgi:hypothetical protein